MPGPGTTMETINITGVVDVPYTTSYVFSDDVEPVRYAWLRIVAEVRLLQWDTAKPQECVGITHARTHVMTHGASCLAFRWDWCQVIRRLSGHGVFY
jgi:hypothetical protein